MRNWRIAGIVFGLAWSAAPALAGQHLCRAPLADWQPPTVLRERLAAEGWSDIRIRIDDGCYKARASNERGERLERKFDPATLVPLRRGGEGGRDTHHDAGEPD